MRKKVKIKNQCCIYYFLYLLCLRKEINYKMKKILRTVSLVALLGCLFACNNTTSSSVSSSSSTQSISSVESSNEESSTSSTSESSELSEESSSESLSEESSTSEQSESSSSEAVVEATGVTLDQTAVTLKITKDVANPTVTLVATVAPENATDKTVTWETSDETIATVADGVVTGLKYGTATITVKKGDFTATCEVKVETELPEPVVTTIAELAVDDTKLVKVTGVVDNVVSTLYGNFDLVDVTTGNKVYVYGLGAKETIAQDFYWKEGKLKYSNPKSYGSLNVQAGDEITVVGVYYEYVDRSGKSTLELSGYLDSKGDGSKYKYTASVEVNDSTMGSATLSKTTDITYGEEIEVIPAPAEGYTVEKVEINGRGIAANEGKYTFKAGLENKVVVTFTEVSDTPLESATYDCAVNATTFSNQTVNYKESTATIDGLIITCSNACYNAPSATGDWVGDSEKKVIICAKNSTQYVTIEKEGMTGVEFNLRSWGTKAQALTFTVEYYDSATSSWVSTYNDGESAFSTAGLATGKNFTIASGSKTFTSSKLRLVYSTTSKSNQTSALLSIKVTY